MAITGFLQIPDVPGESLMVGHEGEIDVIGLEWGIARESSRSAGSRRRRARAEPRPLVALKWVDLATPCIARAVAIGKQFDEIVLTVARESGEGLVDFFVLTFEGCRLVAQEIENGGFDDAAVLIRERVTIDYASVKVVYRQLAADGSAGAEHETEIDFSGL